MTLTGKILIVSPEYGDTAGGAGIALEQLNRELKHDVLCPKIKRKCPHRWSLPELIKWILIARKEFKKISDRYHLIHLWFGVPSGFVIFGSNKPYIISLRGSDVPGFNCRFGFWEFFLKPYYRFLWKNARKLVVNSGELKELASRFLNLDYEIIPNGVDFTKYRHNLKPEYNRLLTVARLIKRKRVDLSIDYLRRYLDKGYVASLTIVGTGPQEKRLRKMARGLPVKFLGKIDRIKMPAIYQRHNEFVLFSEHEGCSNAVLEAKASGLKIIPKERDYDLLSWKQIADMYREIYEKNKV